MRRTWAVIIMTIGITVVSTNALAAPSDARKVDEFGDVNCEDEMARLDNFANELQNDPGAQGYIVFYGGKRHQARSSNRSTLLLPRRGEAAARAARLKPYLSERRGVGQARISVVNGGYRDQWAVELWIVPKGANAPTPSPTVSGREIRFRGGKIRKRDYECGV